MRRLAGVALVVGAIVVPSLSARANNQGVQIQETAYTPAALTITVDDTVTWTYSGADFHSVTADDGSFDSSPSCVALTGTNCMADGRSYPHTFHSTGTFTYHCKVHAMTGSITVEAAATTTTTTTTTIATTTSSVDTSTTVPADQTTITQGSLPSLPSSSHVALPKSISRSSRVDDERPWVFLAVAIAGATTIAGVVLVRRGRVPFG